MACDLNNWLQDETPPEQWKLNKDEKGTLACSIDLNKLSLESRFPFKFKTSDGQWLDLLTFYPRRKNQCPVFRILFSIFVGRGKIFYLFVLSKMIILTHLAKWTSLLPEKPRLFRTGNKGIFRLFAPRAHQVNLRTSEEAKFANNVAI